jgi:hypothetical protein
VRARRGLTGAILAALVFAGGVVAVSRPFGVPRPALPAAADVVHTPSARAEVKRQAGAVLRRQTAALLAGDLDAFTAGALPAARTVLARRFRGLRALGVTRFDQRIDGVSARSEGDWRVAVVAGYCLVERDCDADHARYDILWRTTSAGLRLSGFRLHDPEPWETTELAARAGSRTLVAVPLADRGRLADLSRRAEAAATIADRYTVGGGRVDRYRVFVADAASWKRWYTGFPGRWVTGRSVPAAGGDGRIEVEVPLRRLTPGSADAILRHELTHVATLRSGSFSHRDDAWWLVEGIAEYVELRGGPGDVPGEAAALRLFVRAHRLVSVGVPPPARSASASDAAGRYAVGFFAVDHLMAAYGHAATLNFFRQAVRQGRSLDAAARSAFHKPWSHVNRECATAVRHT